MTFLNNNYIKYFLGILSLNIILFLVVPMFYRNNGIEQLSIKDKLNLQLMYIVFYKRGLAGFRKDDVNNLKNYYINDPLGIKIFNKVKNEYKNGVAAWDLIFKKIFVIGNPALVKFILDKSPNVFGPSTFKHIFTGKIMPNNIGVTKCPFSKTQICKEYTEKREMNEHVFGTKKGIDFKKHIINSICKNLNNKLNNADDFKDFTLNSMADLYFGHNNPQLQKILKEMFNFIDMDSDLSIKSLFNKLSYARKPMERVAEYIRNNDMGSGIFSRFKNYEYMNNHEFDLSNEIPHWIGPYMAMMSFFLPILLFTITKRPDVYETLMSEIDSGILDIATTNTYIHYCVIEFLRLYNILFVQPARICQGDIEFKGIKIPKGTELALNLNTLLRDEKEFNNPDDFIPKRWEHKDLETQHIVFGFGTQRCPSIHFTPLVFKITLKKLLTKFKYDINSNTYPSSTVPQWIDGYSINF